jgi:hypothetical protein
MRDTLNTNYYSLQGEVLISKRDASGNPGSFWMVGNTPKCEVALTVERRKHKESRSGLRLYDKVQTTVKGGSFTMTMEDIRKDNVALATMGNKVALASGSYSGANYDTFASGLVVGSIVGLARPNVSSLVIKDSAGTPATLVLGTDYELMDAGHGLVRILNLGTYVQPFRAQYSYAATDRITGLEASDDAEYYVRIAGINTEADPDQRLGGHIYRVVFDPTKLLALINDQQGSFDLTGEILRDAVRAQDNNFGGFLALDYVDANQ